MLQIELLLDQIMRFKTKKVEIENKYIYKNPAQSFSKDEMQYNYLEDKDFTKRIEILRNILQYLSRARNDAENYSEKEITEEKEEEYMNFLEKIREEGKIEGKMERKLEGELKG